MDPTTTLRETARALRDLIERLDPTEMRDECLGLIAECERLAQVASAHDRRASSVRSSDSGDAFKATGTRRRAPRSIHPR